MDERSYWSFCIVCWDGNCLSWTLIYDIIDQIIHHPGQVFVLTEASICIFMISSPRALADQLECHSLPVTFTSSIRALPLPVPWVGVVVRRWHITNPNGNHSHYHNHNRNPNRPNWIMGNCWTIRKQIRGAELDRIGLVFAVLYIYAFHWL